MNRCACIEYLDHSLKMVGKRRENILKRNLFTLMSSSEMVAQTRFYGIMYLAFCVPLRWLAGKTHELADYPEGAPPEGQWGTKSLVRVADHLVDVIDELIEDPSLFLSETHMMGLFKIFLDELPLFQEYWDNFFVKNK